MKVLSSLAAALLFASSSYAEDQKISAEQRTLAQELETLAAWEFGHRRHAFEVNGCQITTYVWEDWNEHKHVLWSSFLVDVNVTRLKTTNKKTNEKFGFVENGQFPTLSLLWFEVLPPNTARHEMAQRRNPKPPHRPSPRKGLDSYVYKDKKDFLILLRGHPDASRIKAFAETYERYRLEYCTPVG